MQVVHEWSALLAEAPRKALGLGAWLLAMALLFGMLERWRPVRRQRFWRASLGEDVGYFFLGGILPPFFTVIAAGALAWAIGTLVPADAHSALTQTPAWLRLAVVVVLGDTAYYWAHRWSHEIPWLWRFHKVHHAPTSLDWLVNTRAHVVDLVFVRAVAVLPILALGAGRGTLSGLGGPITFYLTVSTVWAFAVHANVNWRLGWLEHLLVSPAFHHWHHCNEGAHAQGRNYASLLPGIDRLFGTFDLPRDRFPSSYGLSSSIHSGA
jgi:sterol desaturase/sphingolipid hydroxylase (fatty acid hydroxylase superfamily)